MAGNSPVGGNSPNGSGLNSPGSGRNSPSGGNSPPTSIPTTGIVLWLQADLLSGADGSSVSTWADSSGGGNDATGTGAARPLLKTGANGLNGLNVVRFNGTASAMFGSIPSVGSTGMTVYYVARTGATLNNWPAVLCSTGATSTTSGVSWSWSLGQNGVQGAGYAGPTSAIGLPPASPAVANTAYYARYRTNKVTWSMDGFGSSTPVADTSFPSGAFNYGLGHDRNGIQFLDADLCEIIMYARVVQSGEDSSIKSNLKTKWGL